jgi:hypothetical protein
MAKAFSVIGRDERRATAAGQACRASTQGMDTRSDEPVLNDKLLAEKEELLVDQ